MWIIETEIQIMPAIFVDRGGYLYSTEPLNALRSPRLFISLGLDNRPVCLDLKSYAGAKEQNNDRYSTHNLKATLNQFSCLKTSNFETQFDPKNDSKKSSAKFLLNEQIAKNLSSSQF